MIIPGTLTISRSMNSKEQWIEVTIKDDGSRESITAKLTLEEFAMAVMGVGYRPCEVETPSDPSRLGRIKERMQVSAPVPTGNRKDAAAAVIAATPEGWEPELYFNSQESFSGFGSGLVAHTSASRWVKRGEE